MTEILEFPRQEKSPAQCTGMIHKVLYGGTELWTLAIWNKETQASTRMPFADITLAVQMAVELERVCGIPYIIEHAPQKSKP